MSDRLKSGASSSTYIWIRLKTVLIQKESSAYMRLIPYPNVNAEGQILFNMQPGQLGFFAIQTCLP